MKPFELIHHPRATFGRRQRRAFVGLALAGLVVAFVWIITLQTLSGRSVVPIVITSMLGFAASCVLAMIERDSAGHVVLEFLHHVVVAILAAVVAAIATGASVLMTVDVASVGLLIILMFGRIACHLGGCCHGRPVRRGVTYRPATFAYRSQGFAGVPLAPVQLIESGVAALLIGAGTTIVLTADLPGAAAAIGLGSYGLARIVTEAWRGDPGRKGNALANHATVAAVGLVAISVVLVSAIVGEFAWLAASIGVAALTLAVSTHFAGRGRALMADDLLLAASLSRNAIRYSHTPAPVRSRSGYTFRTAVIGGETRVVANPSSSLSSRDIRLLDRTVRAAGRGTTSLTPTT